MIPLDEPDCSQQERDLETRSKIHKKNLAAHKQTSKLCINIIQWSSKAGKQEEGGLDSQLAACVVSEVWKRTGGVRLDFRLGRISQETPHSQGRAMARAEFIVLGFPEQGFVLSLGFTAFATNECPFYDYNTPSLCLHSPICPSEGLLLL